MGFRELDKELQGLLPKFADDPFRTAYIKLLREINGNLDTVALCARAVVEQLDKTRQVQESTAGALLALGEEVLQLRKALEQQKPAPADNGRKKKS